MKFTQTPCCCSYTLVEPDIKINNSFLNFIGRLLTGLVHNLVGCAPILVKIRLDNRFVIYYSRLSSFNHPQVCCHN